MFIPLWAIVLVAITFFGIVARGFRAEVVLDAEPELPIAFVVTDAFSGTVLNFRKHVLHLPRPTPVRG